MAQRLNIRAVRERRGLTQRELADKVGLAPSSICKFESGLKYPSMTTLLRLGVALDVSVSEFFVPEPRGQIAPEIF